MNDYYADLGVSRKATTEEIKRAYRRLARTLHPDHNQGDDEAEERFKKVSQAYDVLSDDAKRRAYDMGADPYATAGANFGAGFSFSDIMEQFFGAAAAGRRGPRSREQRGQDGLAGLEIDLPQAVFGDFADLTIETAVGCDTCHGDGAQPGTGRRTCDLCQGRGEVQHVQQSFLGRVMTSRPCQACQGFGEVTTHPCFECSGQGRVRTRRTMKVKIPAGVDTGTRIHLPGEGEVGPGGGPAGDLYVELRVRPHGTFTRQGDDLHATLPLPMTAAALGTTVQFETLDGPHSLDIKPGIQPGETIVLKGLGVTRLRSGQRGNLVVHADVRTPTKLDADQVALLTSLAAARGEEQPAGSLAPVDSSLRTRIRDAFKQR